MYCLFPPLPPLLSSPSPPLPPLLSLPSSPSTSLIVSAYCATFNSNKSLFCYGFSNSSLCLWPELPSTTDHMTSHDHHAHTSTTAEQETASRGQPPFASLLGHRGAVYGACFNSRGQYLLSSSEDCSVRMWDVDKRSCVVCYRGHQYPVWNVVFRYPHYQLSLHLHVHVHILFATSFYI